MISFHHDSMDLCTCGSANVCLRQCFDRKASKHMISTLSTLWLHSGRSQFSFTENVPPPPKKKERERGSKMKRKRLNERKWEKGKVRCATKERWCYWSTWGWLIHKLVMPHGPIRTHKYTQIHTESCILRHAYAIHKYLVTWLNTHPNTHPYTHQYTSHPLVWNWFSETCVLVQQLVTNEPKWPPPCHSFQARAGNDGPWGRKTGREEGSEGLDLNGAH